MACPESNTVFRRFGVIGCLRPRTRLPAVAGRYWSGVRRRWRRVAADCAAFPNHRGELQNERIRLRCFHWVCKRFLIWRAACMYTCLVGCGGESGSLHLAWFCRMGNLLIKWATA